ncbi:hypothetical protein chiPu_0025595 [Chiloscyllium punctatum]|uniref:Uncharacterized protein n=1 Tax=Chiloscyllium punctatum TaxID=137246 RepID=A0A401TGJ9_CHIPU|nr:hypothetical protein [Chiloscyllium punctatum]
MTSLDVTGHPAPPPARPARAPGDTSRRRDKKRKLRVMEIKGERGAKAKYCWNVRAITRSAEVPHRQCKTKLPPTPPPESSSVMC